MAESKPKRSYRSTHRQEQARQTRLKILAEARKLFIAQGYASTTIEAIAREAGVSPETIYAAFSSKLNLLARLVDVSVVGDEEPVPLLQRENIQSARQETDPHHLIIRISPLREGLSPSLAAETARVVTSGEAFQLLTVDRGWSREQSTRPSRSSATGSRKDVRRSSISSIPTRS